MEMNERIDGKLSAPTERLGCGEFTQYMTADDYNMIKMALEAFVRHADKVRRGELKQLTVWDIELPQSKE